jgi:hypothetical protein
MGEAEIGNSGGLSAVPLRQQLTQNFLAAQRRLNIITSRVQARHPILEGCRLNAKPSGNYSLWHLCCLKLDE